MLVKNNVFFGDDALSKLIEGMGILHEAVSRTLGPGGLLCVREKVMWGYPKTTKDGATVARNIFIDDAAAQQGVEILKEAALRTCDEAGDGTTTSTILAYHLVKMAYEDIRRGHNRKAVIYAYKRHVKKYLDVLKTMGEMVPDVKDDKIRGVASIASNGDTELADAVLDAFGQAGEQAHVTVELSTTGKTYAEVTHGFTLDSGFITPQFMGKSPEELSKGLRIMHDALIVLFPFSLSRIENMTRFLDKLKSTGKEILLITNNLEGNSLASLVANYHRQDDPLKICAIKPPYQDSALNDKLYEDLALYTGGGLISQEDGIRVQDLNTSKVGSAKKVIVGPDKTWVIEGAGSGQAIEGRIYQLREKITDNPDSPDIESWRERISLLQGAVGVVKVGGYTRQEAEERKDRADDCVHAVRSALEEGVCTAGGLTWLKLVQKVNEDNPNFIENLSDLLENLVDRDEEELNLWDILYNENNERFLDAEESYDIGIALALLSPLYILIKNAASYTNDPVECIQHFLKSPSDFLRFDDERGGLFIVFDQPNVSLYDPLKVLRCALQNAWSVAELILNTHTLLSIKSSDAESEAAVKNRMMQMQISMGQM